MSYTDKIGAYWPCAYAEPQKICPSMVFFRSLGPGLEIDVQARLSVLPAPQAG